MVLYLSAFFLKTHNLLVILKQEIRQNQTEKYSIKYFSNALQNCQHLQKQGKSKELSQSSRAQVDVVTKHNMIH